MGNSVAVASLRDDPLSALWARHQIDDAKYVAGRHWQKLYEAAEIGDLRGVSSRRRPQRSRDPHRSLHPSHGHADALLRGVRSARGDALVRDLLGRGPCLFEVAAARGLGTQRGTEYLGMRPRECLETLAHEFGYA